MINSNAQLETSAMALIKMLRGGMFTLPAATRRKLGLKDGDYVQAVEVEEGVLLNRLLTKSGWADSLWLWQGGSGHGTRAAG